jgi:uncharacterized protein (DUF1684 family)
MPRLMRSTRLALLSLLLLTGAADAIAAGGAGYAAGIQKWRRDFDADVRTGGWLALIGRFKLGEGASTLGSDPGCTMILPVQAPRQLGIITRRAESFQYEPAPGVPTTMDGEALSGLTQLSTKGGSGRVRTGNFLFDVRAVGEDFYFLIQDSGNPAIAKFKGTIWFPIDPGYRVRARFLPYAQPEQVFNPLTHVDSKELFTSTGDVTFQLSGKSIRLKSFVDEGQLFVMFQDRTNGRQTYGGGRFLHAPLPRNGSTVLDFNKAFNPYCSVNFYVMCPVPPPENRIDGIVAAGEKFDSHD